MVLIKQQWMSVNDKKIVPEIHHYKLDSKNKPI